MPTPSRQRTMTHRVRETLADGHIRRFRKPPTKVDAVCSFLELDSDLLRVCLSLLSGHVLALPADDL